MAVAARAPLDVDLEDKLVYGLTPTRLAYMAIALVAGLALWSSQWAPAVVRAVASSGVIAAGAVAAWGRWHGRPADRWVVDFCVFVWSNYRIQVTVGKPRWAAGPEAADQPTDAMDRRELNELPIAA